MDYASVFPADEATSGAVESRSSYAWEPRFQAEFFRFLRLRQYDQLGDAVSKPIAASTRAANTVLLVYVFDGSEMGCGIALVGKHCNAHL
jgi:hypothetical protein